MREGTKLDRGIKDGFKEACAVVFFITSDFKDEKWLSDEIDYAKQEEHEKGDRFAIITLVPQH